MASEIERLNGTLKVKVDESGNYEQRFKSLQQEYESFRNGQARGLSQEND
jgi:hypothetical protein